MPLAVDPWLSGNFAPVSDETTIADLLVDGELPVALTGMYVRHGPNPIGTPPHGYHPIAGDGMVHAVTLRAGRAVAYRNRWVRTTEAAARLGIEPAAGPPPPAYDRSNTTVVPFAGRILSVSAGALPYELTPALDTVGRMDFGGALPHGMSAHPKTDPLTGALHAVSTWWQPPYLHHHVLAPRGGTVVTTPVALAEPVFVHDFGLSRRHLVLFDQPAVLDVAAAMAGRPFPFAWHPERGSRLGLVDRHDLTVQWLDTDTCFTAHVVNAFDDGDAVVVDLVVADHPPLAADTAAPPRLERWVAHLKRPRVERHVVDAAPQDFPHVNPVALGGACRYAYTVALEADGRTPADHVLKHHLACGVTESHDLGPSMHASEFVFVVDPARTGDEDGGWLVGFAHGDESRHTRLIVVDAQHMTAPPVATVHIPRRVPFGFHAAWIPAL